MSTWAARLAMSTGRSSGKTAHQNKLMPFTTEFPPSAEAELLGSDDPSLKDKQTSVETPFSESKNEQIVDELLYLAYKHNSNVDVVPSLRLPMDVWQEISFFLSHRELLQLAGTCHILSDQIMQCNSIWDQQLCFWHQDIMDLRGGTLLLNAFMSEGKCSSYERFKRERQLYTLDAYREWHFRELETLEDTLTGFFTLPLHLGQENTEGDVATPVRSDSIRGHIRPAVRNNTHAHPRLPAVGQPFIGADEPTLKLRIWHSICPREAHSEQWFDNATGRSSIPIKFESDSVCEDWNRYPSDAPLSAEEEEAMVRYALALSEAETSGQLPPTPPVFLTEPSKASRHITTKESVRSPSRGTYRDPSGGSCAGGYTCLKPNEIMTLIDMINSGTMAQSIIPLVDATEQEDQLFLLAMAETLKGAKRRRLHLGNHHRALANNGQTVRRRLGQQSVRNGRNVLNALSPSPSPILEDASSFPALSDPANIIGGNSATISLLTPPLQSRSPSTRRAGLSGNAFILSPSLPPPPINSMLRNFTGELLEINKREAYQLCEEFLGSSQRLNDFVIFHENGSCPSGKGGVESSASFRPQTRFFLAPELCRSGRIGVIVVDIVRMLIIVEDEKTSRDDPAWMQAYARVNRSGRLVMPGNGYNAQYYERTELRPL